MDSVFEGNVNVIALTINETFDADEWKTETTFSRAFYIVLELQFDVLLATYRFFLL